MGEMYVPAIAVVTYKIHTHFWTAIKEENMSKQAIAGTYISPIFLKSLLVG